MVAPFQSVGSVHRARWAQPASGRVGCLHRCSAEGGGCSSPPPAMLRCRLGAVLVAAAALPTPVSSRLWRCAVHGANTAEQSPSAGHRITDSLFIAWPHAGLEGSRASAHTRWPVQAATSGPSRMRGQQLWIDRPRANQTKLMYTGAQAHPCLELQPTKTQHNHWHTCAPPPLAARPLEKRGRKHIKQAAGAMSFSRYLPTRGGGEKRRLS